MRTFLDHTNANACMDFPMIKQKRNVLVRNIAHFNLRINNFCSTFISISNKTRVYVFKKNFKIFTVIFLYTFSQIMMNAQLVIRVNPI